MHRQFPSCWTQFEDKVVHMKSFITGHAMPLPSVVVVCVGDKAEEYSSIKCYRVRVQTVFFLCIYLLFCSEQHDKIYGIYLILSISLKA